MYLHWVASGDRSGNLVFSGLGANTNFARIGIYSIDGDTLESVTLITAGDGFRTLKQVELNKAAAAAAVIEVPEPASGLLI